MNQPERCDLFVMEADRFYVQVTSDPLDLAKISELVADPSVGAISTFSGVTRNHFQGKTVVRLEYEAYEPMALKKMREICEVASGKWAIHRMVVIHRTGAVGVGEASVIIAASSPHRRDSLEAVHWAIDELKAKVPIWKLEKYEDGSAWKENEESRALVQAASHH